MMQKEKKDTRQLLDELIHELNRMNIHDLLQFRQEWIEELAHQGLTWFVVDFCGRAADSVLQMKIGQIRKLLGKEK